MDKVNIIGNRPSQVRMKQLLSLESPISVSALSGPSGLGKRSFLESSLQELLEDPDWMKVGSDVDGARESVSFLRSDPVFSPYRAVVVDGADFLSEPAQDAYLKLCEEPPPNGRIFFVMEDDWLLLPALRSRLQEVVKWSRLTNDDLNEFVESRPHPVDSDAKDLCLGIPNMYDVMRGNSEYSSLRSIISDIVCGKSDPMSIPIPNVVRSLSSGDSLERRAVASVCRSGSIPWLGDRDSIHRARSFLRLSSTLSRYPSANAEVHWQRTSVSCLTVI